MKKKTPWDHIQINNMGMTCKKTNTMGKVGRTPWVYKQNY